jgi:site-specific recombinase XerD
MVLILKGNPDSMQNQSLIIYPKNTHHNVLEKSEPQNSFHHWLKLYLKDEVYGIQSKHTLEAKTRDLLSFINWFSNFNGHSKIEEWHPRDTQIFLSQLEQLGRAATTINRTFASLRRWARWIHEQPDSPFRQGLPTRGIKEIAVDEPDCKKLSTRELHRLFKAAENLVHLKPRKNARPQRDRAILHLLYYTGLRVSELTALKKSQYDGKYLLEVRRKGKSRSKAIYLPTACREMLDRYIDIERPQDDQHNTQAPLFLSSQSKSLLGRDQVFRILKHIAQEANKHTLDNPVEIHPHKLRHTFGAEFRDKTGSDTETQQALGHVSLKYVGRYVRRTQEEREATLERIGEQLG